MRGPIPFQNDVSLENKTKDETDTTQIPNNNDISMCNQMVMSEIRE